MQKQFFLFGWFLILLYSCNGNTDEVTPARTYNEGYFILNEGPFNTGTGTVSFLDEDRSTIENQAFQYSNDSVVGNILQSGIIDHQDLYLVVNNAHRIIISDRNTLKIKKIFTQGLNNPRYMAAADDKAFVSNWGDPSNPNDDFVAVYNLNNDVLVHTIPVSEGPEQVLRNGDNLYINHTGGWGYNNLISVVNIYTNALETTINVGDVPNSMQIVNGYLYVLCGGKPSFSGQETEAGLYKIDLQTHQAQQVSDLASFSSGIDHAENLLYHNDQFYMNLNGDYYTLDVDANVTQAHLFIEENFYKAYWEDQYFFGLDAGDFNGPGYVKIFQEDGIFLERFIVGTIPTMVIKNPS